VEQREGALATAEDLLRVHTEAHVETVRSACLLAEESDAIVALEPDTKVSSASWDAAMGSAGTVIEAVRAVAEGSLKTGFVAARPPGHHATPDRAMGFCLFNNVAVAVRWLQACAHADRVLIVDWDVHHGNGTQDIFYSDPSVFYLSLHQSPHFPGTGAAHERGAGRGVGTTLNVPLPGGTTAEEYRRHFTAALMAATDVFTPDFVLVSAGFDVMAGDPLGDFQLAAADLFDMTNEIREVAAASCGGRLVAALEGGYAPPSLGQGAVSVIRALAGLESPGP
jgi:acetoin utilization deacetylase AcuC-like enzyme